MLVSIASAHSHHSETIHFSKKSEAACIDCLSEREKVADSRHVGLIAVTHLAQLPCLLFHIKTSVTCDLCMYNSHDHVGDAMSLLNFSSKS